MPRNQSTAAQRARQAQKNADGGQYTELLRAEQQSPSKRLAAALETAELTHEAHRLRVALRPDPEWEAATAAYEAAYEAEDRARQAGAPSRVLDRLYEATLEANQRMGDLCSYTDPFKGDRDVCRAVLMGLYHAGKYEDSPCLRPAADVLADRAKMALAWADGIRGFMPLKRLSGPLTPGPTAARAAYRSLAEATKLPFNGDEEWTRCGELIEEAAALARAACRRQ
ncbi:hypothetical protein [Streptomyces chartreusis]|uniref:hypothetical protein n=1 Tax=Streptomyces chartreusis TaxID=1969 RepID=UPI002E809C41|nr:hypothetical protein [Streptomyces chartreusis]WUB15334.1 hypothetical protein OG997_00905 [Streptomyces chartreusis]